MIIDENEQGIVCIDGRPVADHYKDRQVTVGRTAILPPQLCDPPATLPVCIAGMLILARSENYDAACAFKDRYQGTYGYRDAAAAITGLTTVQVASLEAGWCDFWSEHRDPEFYRLGAKAMAQCCEALGLVQNRG